MTTSMESFSHIYSFDIFDTLISRDVADPRSIWVLMSVGLSGERITDWPIDLVIDFKTIRREAEKRCTDTIEGNEATLDGIYAEIGKYYPELPEAKLEQLKQMEIELELKHIYGIAENIACVFRHLERGEKVILASDMYLPLDVICELLRKAEPRLADLKIYLSSDRKAGKTSGELFKVIFREENVSPSQVHHLGDNYAADYAMPKSLGVNASYYSESKLKEHESRYSEKHFGLLANAAAGISKRLRLAQPVASRPYELGACFTAPFFYGFIHDLLNKPQEAAPEAFYFLARDGFILKEMAQQMCQRLGLKKELRYLYVSRESVYLAAIYRINSTNLNQILDGHSDAPTMQQIADLLKIETHALEGLLPEVEDAEKPLNQSEVERLKKEMIKSEKANEAIAQAAREARKALVGYLRQEGVLDHGKFALVDVGWRASIQDALYSALLEEKPDIKMHGYYYGSSEVSEQTVSPNSKSAYIVKPSNRQKILKIIEVLTVANHGRTLGYEQSAQGAYSPKLEATDESLSQDEKADYFRGIHDFTIQMSDFLANYPAIQADFLAIDNCLLQDLTAGNQFVADCLGDLTFASGAFDAAKAPMSPRFSILESFKYIFVKSSQRHQMTQWIEGTKARSSMPSKAVLALDFRIIISDIFRQIATRDQIRILLKKLRAKL